MTLLDAQLFINTIDELGDSVTVRTVSDTTYSDYGDATESTTDSTSVKCVINDFTNDEIKESEGILRQDSKRFYFKSDRTDINEGNRIIFDSITYEIVRVLKGQAQGSAFIIEAWGNKT